MEKTEWLIDKLKRQFDAAAGATAMLSTLQLLQQELAAQIITPSATQKIAVLMPAPQWSTHAADELDAYETENLRSKDEQKVVFELDPYVEEDAEPEEMLTDEDDEPAIPTAIPEPVHQLSSLPEMETPAPQTSRPAEPIMAAFIPPSVEATVMPNPVPETDKKSLNDLHESPVPETFNRNMDPIKDLKRAISINDRYLYINSLFSGDETAYDRSIKTINNFNVYSEAEYWMRRELSVKYGWEENDQIVHQFHDLVSRRFA